MYYSYSGRLQHFVEWTQEGQRYFDNEALQSSVVDDSHPSIHAVAHWATRTVHHLVEVQEYPASHNPASHNPA
jgi:hypothetical protein